LYCYADVQDELAKALKRASDAEDQVKALQARVRAVQGVGCSTEVAQ
jgi:hypothetical protein